MDFQSFSRDIVLNEDVTEVSFRLNITDDDEFEEEEMFNIVLTFLEGFDANITLSPDTARIVIFDNDFLPLPLG